ncbi:MAG: hypothetical protein K5871_03535 [Lachnospiraceae bacterium]|nr:hypothetical protein [Lachnospiraceae bacterium]
MKDFDKIYDLFDEACEEADEGVCSESGLQKFRDVLEALGEPKNSKADKESILYAYALSHLAYATLSLAVFEYDSDVISEKKALDHYAEALEGFRKSMNAFESMEQTDDRDYLYADSCQMFAEFIRIICCDSEKRGLKDLNEEDIENLYKKSIDLYENLLSGEAYDTREELVDVCYNAAGYYYDKDRYDKSHPLFERSKAIAEELEAEEPGAYEEFLGSIDDYLEDGKNGKLFV